MAKVSKLTLEAQSGSSTTVFASWTMSGVKTDTISHYYVRWAYQTGDSTWFDGGNAEVKLPYLSATYSYPSNATIIRCIVKPVAKTRKVNDKDTPYWTGVNEVAYLKIRELPPDKLSTPDVEIDKYNLTATVDNIPDTKVDQVHFYVERNNVGYKNGVVDVVRKRAVYSCTIGAGHKYRVKCRGINLVGSTKVYGPWSDYTSDESVIPVSPRDVKCYVESETSVRVTWTKPKTSTSFEVQYTTDKKYFDSSSSEVQSVRVETNYAYITGLDPGHEYYFRVRSINDKGESGWSGAVYAVLGTKPEPPTTWSLTTTAIIGEPVTLYWVHNSEDGSKQNQANIELVVNGQSEIITIDTSKDEVKDDEIDKVYSYELDISKYTEGAEILWHVRTRGITSSYSEWSIQRTINIYAPPALGLRLGSGESEYLETFPYHIEAMAGPDSQQAISFHVSITAEFEHETENDIGETIVISEGQEVYSNIFIQSENTLSYDLLPSDVILENGQAYKVTVTVSMNSGLTAEASDTFIVRWSDEMYQPDASVIVDPDSLCAYISPFCLDDEGNVIENVVLSVYRREFDGTFTEIMSNIANTESMTITDPHPSLDYARYRIVARNTNTREIGYVDLPGIPVDEPGIVIQWDENWRYFDFIEEAEAEEPLWSGSMLRLRYNVDISESNDIDRSLVEYIGRKHPVGYYGTQRGSGGTWSTDIPADDKETIYALRRLMNWAGDVYVRESSGNGYNAQIKVSMSKKHTETTIPVTFDVKRVEGGI